MAVALESIYHAELDAMPNVSRARRQTEWFKTSQNTFRNVKLALQSVGQGVFYDFSKFPSNAMPSAFVGKGKKLEGGQTLETTTHGFRESPRLQELRKALQAGDEVEGEDGIIRLDPSDIEDIRKGTPRGQQLLELITRREKATGSTQTMQSKSTQAPLNVRMTRSQLAALRNAQTKEEEKQRKRVARALAQLAI